MYACMYDCNIATAIPVGGNVVYAGGGADECRRRRPRRGRRPVRHTRVSILQYCNTRRPGGTEERAAALAKLI